jgi:hypothetical protein
VPTTSSPDPDDIFAGVDLSEVYVPADATELSERSILASRTGPLEVAAPAEAIVRLSGEGVQRNRIGARQASRILGTLQEVLAAIGQSLSGNPTSRGQIPNFIRQRTALNLFPVPAAGSVQLRLEAPILESTLQFGTMQDANLADESAADLVKLMEEVSEVTIDETPVVEHLRSLGPRVARQVQQLATELVRDDVDLDLTWRRFSERPQIGRLHRERARLLREIIRQSRAEAQIITLVGTLVTISTVRPAAVVLDSGRIVTLTVDDGLTSSLVPFFGQRVEVEVEETVTHEEASGRETAKYQFVSIAAARTNQHGDDPLDAPIE